MKQKIIIFDTEDDSPEVMRKGKSGFDKKVTQIAALSLCGLEYYSRGNVKEFIKWLVDHKPCIVYAHNLQYDLGNLFAEELDKLDVTLIGSRMINARYKGIEFRDSMNLWPMGLIDVGDAFGLKKKKLNIRSKAYVMRDVEITLLAVEFAVKLSEEYDLDKLPNTLGGLAVKIWQSIGGSNWFCDLDFCRAGLYGGRVELFEREAYGNLLWTDINSLYPSVMCFDFPDNLFEKKDITGFGVAGVTIKIPDVFIAPLPYRLDTGKVQYPKGTISGIWTFHEIRNAIEHGAKLLKLHDAVGSDTGSPYYKDFVFRFHALKNEADAEGNKAKKTFYKLLLNNLYGQLAMRGLITKMKGGLMYDRFTSLPRHVNYLHGSYVTAYGRLELFKYLEQIGNKLIYCDTDSTIFHVPSKFKMGDELGQMKLVSKGKYCETYSPKTYVFDDDYVAKGVPKKLAKDYITNKVVEYDQPYKFRDAIRFFDRGNIKKLSVWRPIEKKLVHEYDLKELRKDGKFWPKEPIVKEQKQQLDLEF